MRLSMPGCRGHRSKPAWSIGCSRSAQIPGRLLEYHRNGGRLKLPPEEGPPPLAATPDATGR